MLYLLWQLSLRTINIRSWGGISSNLCHDFIEKDHDFDLFTRQGFVLSKLVRKQNELISNSSLKRCFQVSFNMCVYLTAYRQYQKSQFCFVSSQNWRAEIYQIAFAVLFPWISTLWLLPIRILQERTPRNTRQIAKMEQSLQWQWFWAKSRFEPSQECSTNGSRYYTGTVQMIESTSKSISVNWYAIFASSRNGIYRKDFWDTLYNQ
jgi:hypothetical protein